MDISVIGINHHTASVDVREAFAMGGLTEQLLQELRTDPVFSEVIVLDTCNRTEVYFVSQMPQKALDRLLRRIARLKGKDAIQETSAFYRHDGRAAVEHLLHVAAGLDSQIIGEHQILGQIKNAYRLASAQRTAGFLLNKLMHCAFRVGKRAKSETDIGRGSTNVAQAAVDLSQQVFSSLVGKSAMLVGAGQTGELAAKALVRCGVAEVIVANRSIEKAKTVATEILTMLPGDIELLDFTEEQTKHCPALVSMMDQLNDSLDVDPAVKTIDKPPTRAISLQEIPQFIGQVDLVISATGSQDLVLKADDLAKPISKSKRSIFMVDIAVPRDIDPQLSRLSNVFLYNIDDLGRIIDKNLATRRLEIPRVKAIIQDELESFIKWIDSLQVTPTIKLLQQRFEQARKAEIKRYGKKFKHTDPEQLDQFTNGLCNKILHQPIAFLRAISDSKQANSSDHLAAIDLIRKLFQLDELEQDK